MSNDEIERRTVKHLKSLLAELGELKSDLEKSGLEFDELINHQKMRKTEEVIAVEYFVENILLIDLEGWKDE